MAYQRKTRDEYQIHSDYGYGFEETTAHDSYSSARAELKLYRENQPEFAHKIVKRRIRIEG